MGVRDGISGARKRGARTSSQFPDAWPLDDSEESREAIDYAAKIMADAAAGDPAKAKALLRVHARAIDRLATLLLKTP